MVIVNDGWTTVASNSSQTDFTADYSSKLSIAMHNTVCCAHYRIERDNYYNCYNYYVVCIIMANSISAASLLWCELME